MNVLFDICEKLITGSEYVAKFLTTQVDINVAGFSLVNFTPLELLTIGGLCALAVYYLIRGLVV